MNKNYGLCQSGENDDDIHQGWSQGMAMQYLLMINKKNDDFGGYCRWPQWLVNLKILTMLSQVASNVFSGGLK